MPNDTFYCGRVCTIRVYWTLVGFCSLAVAVNLYILLSTAWLRQRRSPNVKLCISLCAADTFAAVAYISIMAASLTRPPHQCVILIILILMWASTVNCILHVVVIAVVQLVGVWFPIQSRYWLAGRVTPLLIFAMWLLPIISYAVGVSVYQTSISEPICFFNKYFSVGFRTLQTCFVVPALLAICIAYSYMLKLISRRENLQEASAKSQWSSKKQPIVTALLIAASFGVGYLPITIVNQIICPSGCLVNPSEHRGVTLAVIASTCVLTMIKLSANAFIYVSRIPSIRDSIARMHASVLQRPYTPSVSSVREFGMSMRSSFTSTLRRHRRAGPERILYDSAMEHQESVSEPMLAVAQVTSVGMPLGPTTERTVVVTDL